MGRVEKAREAFRKGDIRAAKKYHSKKEVDKEPWHSSSGKYLGNAVYGAIDGIVTTFAVVSGAAGASLNPAVILIMGFANLLGDGISMGLGSYISEKSEKEFIENERRREEWEVDNIPEGEREEIRQIYRRYGFRGKSLNAIVRLITSRKNLWIDEMMVHELGLLEPDTDPAVSGAVTFLAFLAAGMMPLLAYVVPLVLGITIKNQFLLSAATTLISLFIVGAMRQKITGIHWLRGGIEMTVVGGLAAFSAFGVGRLLSGLL